MARIKIDPILKGKITNFIIERNGNQSMPEGSRGSYCKECEYDIVYNEKLPKYIFVRYRKLRFHSGSLGDNKICVIAFDSKTGECIPAFTKSTDNYPGFFGHLKLINKII